MFQNKSYLKIEFRIRKKNPFCSPQCQLLSAPKDHRNHIPKFFIQTNKIGPTVDKMHFWFLRFVEKQAKVFCMCSYRWCRQSLPAARLLWTSPCGTWGPDASWASGKMLSRLLFHLLKRPLKTPARSNRTLVNHWPAGKGATAGQKPHNSTLRHVDL